MSFEIHLEEGERMIANLSFIAGKAGSLNIAISDRAAYLPRKKLFAVSDPNYCERVPLNRILQATIRKLNPHLLWALALLMVIGGTATTALMMMPLLKGGGGTVSGYPPAIAVVGLVIPFIARRRYGLSVSIVDSVFSWNPPLLVDSASRKAVGHFLSQTADAFRQAGVGVRDERQRTSPDAREAERVNIYPVAPAYGDTEDAHGIRRPCYHCGAALDISRWDDWNGFLFYCPACKQQHGKPWSTYRTVLASIFLNAFSFLFTMRWKRALAFFVGFALLFAGLSIAMNRGLLYGVPELILLGIVFLGPFAINSALLLQHETALKTASAVKRQLTH